ncbi:hypothetical protein SARC_12775 [Sphaeroforma arctica JP610]|uniref:Uncharacterized protein n=1 Tax=Sphaeroforma arctica JP610 TaxID=667725 RepID=A0A0L0FD67_9EUKA|nr:hypothetical protein SARC_12775 [Sphaeroforma arctica JP610]KNC74685.1 hypothetical protein SARC_12775 [Sphaeroforma arctica JP610]|eukprot:XP_014148587.1 hypothetical protein SARC_12775 [Sphaeroforma arctica JP610]
MFSRKQISILVLAVILLIQSALAVPITNFSKFDLQKLSLSKPSRENVVTTRTPDGGKRMMIIVRADADIYDTLPSSVLNFAPFTSVWPFTLNNNEASAVQEASRNSSQTKEDTSSVPEAIVRDVQNIIKNVQSTTQYMNMKNEGHMDYKGVASLDSDSKTPAGIRLKMKIQSNSHHNPYWGALIDSPYFLMSTGFLLCLTIFIMLSACCNVAFKVRPTNKGDIVIDFWVAKDNDDLQGINFLKKKTGTLFRANTVSV